ncbi:MAG: S-layer homology domain-containing protein [Candidatus Gracilibacteria bacterium]
MTTKTKKIVLGVFIIAVASGPAFLGGRFLESSLIQTPSQNLRSSAEVNVNDNSISGTGAVIEETKKLSYCPPDCVTPYIPTDLSETHPARYALMLLLAANIFPESSDRIITPDQPLNRGEIASLLAKTFSIPTADRTSLNPFSDISEKDSFYSAVMSMYESKLISGYSDRTFRPNKTLSKAEALKLIASAKYSPSQISQSFALWKSQHSDYTYVYFTDVSVQDWYAPYVYILVSNNILKDESKRLNAGNSITKGEVAIILTGLIQKYNMQFVN